MYIVVTKEDLLRVIVLTEACELTKCKKDMININCDCFFLPLEDAGIGYTYQWVCLLNW